MTRSAALPLVKPDWIRVRAPGGPDYDRTRQILADAGVVTVCREALCPNQAECWRERTATFMIGGSVCTRGCRFCGVGTERRPPPPAADEPARVARAAAALGLTFVVVTSVDRDDLDDQGAAHWAATLRALRGELPRARIEALVPDFRGRTDLLDVVLAAQPDVLSHNLETVPRLYSSVRPGARVDWSLRILAHAAARGCIAKTGVMVGLGETDDEVVALLGMAKDVGVRVVTVGQYLQPTPRHARVERYVSPSQFAALAVRLRDLGLPVVEAGPLVRSSYHAHRHASALLG